jgi:hypothetical protein
LSENSAPADGITESSNSTTSAKSKRSGHLKVVDEPAASSGAASASVETLPPLSRIPSVDPVSEFRAAQKRRQTDAQAEIALIETTIEQRKARYDAVLAKLDDEYRRAVEFETDRFNAEWTSLEDERRRQQIVLDGTEAALIATIPDDQVLSD